ncbi:MAG: Sua5/YciO/YrdC/YwlC family protein, partial [Proteobacteria bacterium]|nr:Sua5/YciO/YrdC/YwlC family protein [Pseudomonadota bacterium]
PLIVHVLGLDAALQLWQLSPRALRSISILTKAYWPGPLTLVAKAHNSVSTLVKGTGDSVGIRSPSHPLARSLIEVSGVPIAAPSANLFGHVSPTRAMHVAHDFADRELLILDGDDCAIGIESTVVKINDDGNLHWLRHGAITEQEIQKLFEDEAWAVKIQSRIPGHTNQIIDAPGQYLRHYAPSTPAWILSTEMASNRLGESIALSACACLDFAGRQFARRDFFQSYCDLSRAGDLAAAAKILFQELRALEAGTETRVLLLPKLDPSQPAEQALYDRIYRACEGKLAYFSEGKILLS